MSISVNQSDIVTGLKKLGLKSGDVAFIHSSLSSFGYVEGGAETVVRAFLETLGSEGTLSVPIFHNYFWGMWSQVWDRDNTPSLMGRISETVRTWPGVRRSRHAPHPIAAVGALAEDLTERNNRSDFALDSPFARLVELNAWIMLAGVDYNSCTMIHLVEERKQAPYRHWVDLSGTVVEDGVAAKKTFPFYKRYPGVRNDFLRLGERLENEGLVKIEMIGKSVIRCFRAQDLCDCVSRSLDEDPLYLISSDSMKGARGYVESQKVGKPEGRVTR